MRLLQEIDIEGVAKRRQVYQVKYLPQQSIWNLMLSCIPTSYGMLMDMTSLGPLEEEFMDALMGKTVNML